MQKVSKYRAEVGSASPDARKSGHLPASVTISLLPSQTASTTTRSMLTPADLAALLTIHAVGPKGGSAWSPMLFRRDRRSAANAEACAVAVLDVDGGSGVAEAVDALKRNGLAGAVATSHIHTAAEPHIRVAVIARQPWRASDYSDAQAAGRAFKAGLRALAARLCLPADPAAMDAARLFYLPRHPEGTQPEGVWVDGGTADVWPAPGATVEHEAEEPSGERSEEGDGWSDVPAEVLLSALAAIRNDMRFGRGEWIAILAALKGALGEDGREVAERWSEGWEGGHDPDSFDAAWVSLPNTGSPAAVLRFAERDGWRDPRLLQVGSAEGFGDVDLLDVEEVALLDGGDGGATLAQLTAELKAGTAAPLFTPASALLGEPPPRQWLVDGLIPNGTVTMLGGDGGTGKSLLALQLAVTAATHGRWIGREVERPGTVLFLTAEDDLPELHRRLADITSAAGSGMADLDRLLVRSLAGEDALLATLKRGGGNLRSTPLYARLDAAMVDVRPTLLVLDTLADLFGGQENDRGHARQFVGMLRHLALRHGCAVLLLAHPSLSGINSGSGLSGSTAWNASVRSRLYLDRVRDGNGVELDPCLRVLRTLKANYAAIGGEIAVRWEGGVFVADCPDADDSDLLGETAEERAERIFLRLLARFDRQGQKVSPNLSNTYAPALFASDAEGQGIKSQAFAAAMRRLLDNGTLTISEEGPPSRRTKVLRRSGDG